MDNYEEMAERLWEKLESRRPDIEINVYEAVSKQYPVEGMVKAFPEFHQLVDEVEAEFGSYLDLDAQNWAIVRFVRGNMRKYNRLHNKHLSARR